MTIECVTLDTNHFFPGNPIAGQHRLRYDSIIQRQSWPMPTFKNMEYDQYDNPATTYLIWRDEDLVVRGSCRLCQTINGSMLKDHLGFLVDEAESLLEGPDILEGSRFCIDRNTSLSLRKRIAQEIIVAYLEYGLQNNIRSIIGVMYPIYWNNLFEKNGWMPNWIGDVKKTDDGKKSRAGFVNVTQEALRNVRKMTGIYEPVISYGRASTENVNFMKAV